MLLVIRIQLDMFHNLANRHDCVSCVSVPLFVLTRFFADSRFAREWNRLVRDATQKAHTAVDAMPNVPKVDITEVAKQTPSMPSIPNVTIKELAEVSVCICIYKCVYTYTYIYI